MGHTGPPRRLLILALVILVPCAHAATQDPSTYPAGISGVSNTAVAAGVDFDVAIELDGAADNVAAFVCRFASIDDETPFVCYMPLGARKAGTTWTASTSAVDHPDWEDGWVLGYKVMARTSGGDLHAPDRTTSPGEYDYYRVVVGAPDVQGSAVVEDAPAAPLPQAEGPTSKDAPAGLWAVGGLVAALLALRRRHPDL